jgi:hypothetical protein
LSESIRQSFPPAVCWGFFSGRIASLVGPAMMKGIPSSDKAFFCGCQLRFLRHLRKSLPGGKHYNGRRKTTVAAHVRMLHGMFSLAPEGLIPQCQLQPWPSPFAIRSIFCGSPSPFPPSPQPSGNLSSISIFNNNYSQRFTLIPEILDNFGVLLRAILAPGEALRRRHTGCMSTRSASACAA